MSSPTTGTSTATTSGSPSFWRMSRLIAAKDLRVERRSRVVTNQVLPVRRCHDGDLRLRPRQGDRARTGRARADLAGDDVQPARARPAGVRDRGRRRGARRAACRRRRRRGRSSSARRSPWPPSSCCSRWCCSCWPSSSTARRCPAGGVVLLVTTLLTATVWTGRGRYPVRRPCRWDQGPRDVAPAAHAPSGGARSDRSDPSRRISARHGRRGGVGRLALGGPAGRLRRRLRCRRCAWRSGRSSTNNSTMTGSR